LGRWGGEKIFAPLSGTNLPERGGEQGKKRKESRTQRKRTRGARRATIERRGERAGAPPNEMRRRSMARMECWSWDARLRSKQPIRDGTWRQEKRELTQGTAKWSSDSPKQ